MGKTPARYYSALWLQLYKGILLISVVYSTVTLSAASLGKNNVQDEVQNEAQPISPGVEEVELSESTSDEGATETTYNELEASAYADVKPSITLSPLDERIVIANPTPEEIEEILASAFNHSSEFMAEMGEYIVGIRGQDRLMTLADAYKERLISETGAGAILQKVHGFREGETATINLKFGLRNGEDIVIGRFPKAMIGRFPGDHAMHPGDPSLAPLTKWLEIIGHMTWVNPQQAGSGASVNSANALSLDYKINRLAMGVLFNYFQQPHMRNYFGSAFINPVIAGASLGMGTPNASHSLWFNMMSGWGGLGYSGLYNIEENQTSLSAVGAGAFVGGWKNYVQAGVSLTVVTDSGNQLGLGGVMTLHKDRITSYVNKYDGRYDKLLDTYIEEYKKLARYYLDEIKVTERLIVLHQSINNTKRVDAMMEDKVKLEKEYNKALANIWHFKKERDFLTDKHFIEVIDTQSKAFRLQGGVFANGVGMGFRFGASKASESIHRFYAPLIRAQELLKDGNGDKIALLRIPEQFDTEQFPDILKPHLWKIGEEVITTVNTTYHGSIVMGVFAVPGIDAKVGISGTVSGTFEIGLRKLPGNKLEVTFCPTKIKEMGAFISTISSIAELSAAASVAVAMRQTFIFDLDNQKAIDTYMLFMTAGILPLDFSARSSRIIGDEEAQNLLDIAVIARKNLSQKGILLTYLEKIDVPAQKFHVGFARLPIINRKHWAGLSYEYLKGSAKVVSTNAEFAVSRTTSHVETTTGLGRNGTRHWGTYATIRRVFIKDHSQDSKEKNEEIISGSLSDGYTERFKGITLQARMQADKIVGHEHNEIVEKINTMFHANVNRFPETSEGHKQSRDILLERELTGKDLDKFASVKQSQIVQAASASGLEKKTLSSLLARLEDRGHNEMANVIKEFIGEHGLKGFSAIHIMLDGSCRNLIIRTESNSYVDPVKHAITLEAEYTKPFMNDGDKRYLNLTATSPKSKVVKFFKEVKDAIAAIDQGLNDLWEDPLLEGQDDLLKFEDSKLREKKGNIRSKLIAAKNRLLDLLDLNAQEFPGSVIEQFYSYLDEDDRDVFQEFTLVAASYRRPISLHDHRHEILNRWTKVNGLIERLNKEITALDTKLQRKILGVVYVSSTVRKLKYLRSRAQELITLQHLCCNAQAFIEKMTEKKHFFSSANPTYREIASQMEAVCNEQTRLRTGHNEPIFSEASDGN